MRKKTKMRARCGGRRRAAKQAGLFLTWAGALPVLLSAGTLTIERPFQVSLAIPDGGELLNLQTVDFGDAILTDVRVGLVLTGAGGPLFNGDWFAGLGYEHGGYAVLLNRPGKTAAWPFGYFDSGFDVLFSDNAANGDIHLYQQPTGPLGSLPLTGEWQPSGRTALPENVVDTDPRTAMLASFAGRPASGEWRLLLSDESIGGVGRVDSWKLLMQIAPGATGAIQLAEGDRITGTGSVSTPVRVAGTARFAQTGNLHLQGPLQGSGILIHEGAGRLLLSEEGDFAGVIEVRHGELRVTNTTGSATGSASIHVSLAGRLSGTGAIGGPVLIDAGGTLAPGASPGQLSVAAMEWGSGGSFLWDINRANGALGENPGWDGLLVQNTLAITATAANPFTIQLVSLGLDDQGGALANFNPNQTYQWRIASANSITGFSPDVISLVTTQFQSANPIPDGSFFTIGTDGQHLNLNYIPEPRVFAILTGLAAFALVGLRRLRQRG